MFGIDRVPADIGAGVIGVAAGVVVAIYGRIQAQAAVSVRPNLQSVGFLDALLTDHGVDWLYYHYPNAMSLVVVIFISIGFFGTVKWWSS